MTISNINQLSIPNLYKETISFMISKLQHFPVVKDVILFGSCARQNTSQYSDIDLALVVDNPISPEEEGEIDWAIRKWESNLPCDVIFIPKYALEQEIKGETVIRPILQEGVRLSALR